MSVAATEPIEAGSSRAKPSGQDPVTPHQVVIDRAIHQPDRHRR